MRNLYGKFSNSFLGKKLNSIKSVKFIEKINDLEVGNRIRKWKNRILTRKIETVVTETLSNLFSKTKTAVTNDIKENMPATVSITKIVVNGIKMIAGDLVDQSGKLIKNKYILIFVGVGVTLKFVIKKTKKPKEDEKIDLRIKTNYVSKDPSINKRLKKYHDKEEYVRRTKLDRALEKTYRYVTWEDSLLIRRRQLQLNYTPRKVDGKLEEVPKIEEIKINDKNKVIKPHSLYQDLGVYSIDDKHYFPLGDVRMEIDYLKKIEEDKEENDNYSPENPYPFLPDFLIEDYI